MELAIQPWKTMQGSRKIKESGGKGERNFPSQRVPEQWHRGESGDWHTEGAAGRSAWLKQGSRVITDEKVINLFKVLWVVRGRTGLYEVQSLSHSAFPLVAF